MENSTLPILLKSPKVLLIGGGEVAFHKAKVLQHNNISFRVISKEFHQGFEELEGILITKEFKLKDIQKDEQFIINASSSNKVTKKLLKYKKRYNILLNIVNDQKACDFYFMALTSNKPLQIAVSSNGASPTAARYFRDECEKLIPDDIEQYLQQKKFLRDKGIIEAKKTQDELIKKAKQNNLEGKKESFICKLMKIFNK